MPKRSDLQMKYDYDEWVAKWWAFIPDEFKSQFNDEFFEITDEAYNSGHILGQEAGLEDAISVIADYAHNEFWERDMSRWESVEDEDA